MRRRGRMPRVGLVSRLSTLSISFKRTIRLTITLGPFRARTEFRQELRFGFRVPALVISPYSLRGVAVHTQYDLTSPLKLIETKFALVPLTGRDGGANTMLECFNFSQPPLPPDIITPETKLDFSQVRTH